MPLQTLFKIVSSALIELTGNMPGFESHMPNGYAFLPLNLLPMCEVTPQPNNRIFIYLKENIFLEKGVYPIP